MAGSGDDWFHLPPSLNGEVRFVVVSLGISAMTILFV
jgi:hypothetical protein